MRMMASLCLLVLLAGCGGGEKTSFNTTEDQRKMARDNSALLAQAWRAAGGYEAYDLNTRGDSTISPECPQGDGWASIDLINRKLQADNPLRTIHVKCSTYSEGIGCLEETDFKKKTYASEDGHCNPNVPMPIPKIGGK